MKAQMAKRRANNRNHNEMIEGDTYSGKYQMRGAFFGHRMISRRYFEYSYREIFIS